MKTNLGISEENRQSVVNELAKILADEYILYTKTRKAHWNLEGSDFYDKHKLFEAQYQQLDEIIDNVAERIRSLNHYAPGTLKEFLALTQLTEKMDNDNSPTAFIKELLHDHETIAIRLRENINPFADTYKDLGTSDFITSLLQEHEKTAWFLRAHLK